VLGSQAATSQLPEFDQYVLAMGWEAQRRQEPELGPPQPEKKYPNEQEAALEEVLQGEQYHGKEGEGLFM
jgi:hypothetical protein